MALNKSLDTITEQDLQALVNQQEPEGRQLDYKATLNLDQEESKTEFRRDITSFANSLGGDIIVGIRDNKGLPEELSGFELGNASQEQYQSRLREILQSRIKPRIQGISMRIFQLSSGKWSMVIRIPNSFAKPHQVEVGNKDFQFWFRHDVNKQRMDIDDLRSTILLSESLSDRIRNFRIERLGRIIAGDTPVTIAEGTKAILHLIPVTAFDSTARYDLVRIRTNYGSMSPMFSSSYENPRYNFDGFLTHDKHPQETTGYSYVQIFRNGIIESVEGRLFDGPGHRLSSDYFETMVIRALSKYLELQEQLGVTPPILVALSLLGINGYSLTVPDQFRRYPERSINEDNLVIPEELVDNFKIDSNTILKPIFDRIWNAAGWSQSLNYDENGNRK